MIAQLDRTCLGWTAKGTFAKKIGAGLVVAFLALATGTDGASAAPSHHDESLRADLEAILDDHLQARRGPEGITGIAAFVSLAEGEPGISVSAGATDRSGRKPIDRRTRWIPERGATG
jgi:hypothetical protein